MSLDPIDMSIEFFGLLRLGPGVECTIRAASVSLSWRML